MSDPEKGYADQIRDTLDSSAAEFERTFLASSAYQQPVYWQLLMGKMLTDMRDMAENLTAASVNDETVRVLLGLSGALAACADFYVKTYGKDLEPSDGD